MVSDDGSVRNFFPLRSNAAALVAGAPVGSVIARMKIAALLGDVVIEDGTYTVQAGPDGSTGWWAPHDAIGSAKWQSSRERALARGRGFRVVIGQDGQQTGQILIQSEAALSWRATYSPLKEKVSATYAWLNFTSFALTTNGKKLAQGVQQADEKMALNGPESSGFVRSKLLEHVATDTVVACGLGAALVVDKRHGNIISKRLAQGQADRVPILEAAQILQPNVALLDWQDIDQIRRMRGWCELREVWEEVGELALTHAGSSTELANMVNQLYRDRLTEAALAAEGPKGIRRWAGALSGLILGALPSLATLSPGVSIGAGVLASAAGEAVNWSQRAAPSRWIAVSDAITTATDAKQLAPGRQNDEPA